MTEPPRQLLSPDTGRSAATRNRVAIVQPTYLGWAGYFALIDCADTAILLDTVPISKQSWQTRNKVRGRDGRVVWLSVPVHAHMGQPLCEVEVDNGRPWKAKHWRTISSAYSHLPGWPMLDDWLKEGYHNFGWGRLTELTNCYIKTLAYVLGMTTKIVLASELGPTRDGKVERLDDLLTMTQATSYLASHGSTYLEGHTHIGDTPIEWFDYQHPVYEQQGHDEFVSHLSVVDLIANCGTDALTILRHHQGQGG